ncbi:MAG: hypothetical protein U5L11_12410 [Arhodomonas sp.]|nr:hypothetical protein [Arhodomonas sp.]
MITNDDINRLRVERLNQRRSRRQAPADQYTDTWMVGKRLQTVRNLIQLGDTEDAEPQHRKLRSTANAAGPTPILQAIDHGI